MSKEPIGDQVKEAFREFDWGRAVFPSDRMTLGWLRQALGSNHENLGIFIHNLILAEQELAGSALSETLKRSHDEDAAHVAMVLKAEYAKELGGMYEKAGFGPHQAAEMIRELEGWAATEAKKHNFIKLR